MHELLLKKKIESVSTFQMLLVLEIEVFKVSKKVNNSICESVYGIVVEVLNFDVPSFFIIEYA